MGMVPASALVSRWFRARLGTAMGITYAGLGMGVIAVVPLTQWLIERDGWRSTYATLGGFLLILLPILLVLPWKHFAAGNPEFGAERGGVSLVEEGETGTLTLTDAAEGGALSDGNAPGEAESGGV